MTIRSFLLSWDIGAAAAVALLLWHFLPDQVSSAFCKEMYGVGISVLSILFSLWAAALALLMTSPDDAFVRFMEEHHDYAFLVATFKVTLVALFFALALSICLYGFTTLTLGEGKTQSKVLVTGFSLVATYSLVAALLSMLDSIRYAERRVRFLGPKDG